MRAGLWELGCAGLCSHRVSGVSAAGKTVAAQKRKKKEEKSCSFLRVLSLMMGKEQEKCIYQRR